MSALDLADRLEAEARGPFAETTDRNLYAQAASTIRSLSEQTQRVGDLVVTRKELADMMDKADRADALQARVTELEGVLRPFAVKTVDFQGQVRFVGTPPTRADYALARSALSTSTSAKE